MAVEEVVAGAAALVEVVELVLAEAAGIEVVEEE